MNVLMVIPSIDARLGGPSYATLNLCRSLAEEGIGVSLFTTVPTATVPPGTEEGFHTRYFARSFPRRYGNSAALVKDVGAAAMSCDILHVVNLWNCISTRVARVAGDSGIPYVVTLNGMLSAWSRSFGRIDKELYFAIAEKKTIRGAALVHCLTEHEAVASSQFFGKTPWCVIPNGVWLEEHASANPDEFRARFALQGKRVALFLGRLHPIKRLDLQCQTFSLLSRKFPDLHWVFAGPDDGVQNQVRNCLHSTGLDERVVFTGLLSGIDRVSALAAADVYCQTSDHEGHSVAITEALAAGKPCVITEGCNFEEIEQANTGYVVPSVPDRIAEAIDGIISHPELSVQMGRNAVSLVERKYTWQAVAKRMIEAYETVLGHSH